MSQRLIPTGERSGLQTHIAATENVFVAHAEEKLTAFVELESAIRAREESDKSGVMGDCAESFGICSGETRQ